jgi:hypothetical protein
MSPIKCRECAKPIMDGTIYTVYDELFDEYFCDRACHEDWYSSNYSEYFRKYCEVGDD